MRPPPPLAHVHVDIRQGGAPRVQEAFKNEAVFKRVEIRDAHGPGREGAARGAAPRTNGDAVVPGPGNEFVHHKKVGGKAHARDDIHLVPQPFPVRGFVGWRA